MQEFRVILTLSKTFGFGVVTYKDGPFDTGNRCWKVFFGFFDVLILPRGTGFYFYNIWR
jgi:hypothetical protein